MNIYKELPKIMKIIITTITVVEILLWIISVAFVVFGELWFSSAAHSLGMVVFLCIIYLILGVITTLIILFYSLKKGLRFLKLIFILFLIKQPMLLWLIFVLWLLVASA